MNEVRAHSFPEDVDGYLTMDEEEKETWNSEVGLEARTELLDLVERTDSEGKGGHGGNGGQ